MQEYEKKAVKRLLNTCQSDDIALVMDSYRTAHAVVSLLRSSLILTGSMSESEKQKSLEPIEMLMDYVEESCTQLNTVYKAARFVRSVFSEHEVANDNV